MTDILIRGMEMPEGCRECFACFPGRDDNDEPTTYCTLTEPTSPADCWGVIDGIDHQRQRMDFCPLVELPAHGDLIEAEPIKRFITDGLNRKEFGYDQIQVLTEVEYAPVIVPASGEGNANG